MKFLTYTYEDSPERVKACFDSYYLYLNSVKNELPKDTYQFAVNDWHYNFEDPRSPHDSWIEQFLLKEKSERPENKSVDIELRLLGAYHNGSIIINYSDVDKYKLKWNWLQDNEHNSERLWHGDWLIDEISLSITGSVRHEIEFRFNGHWIIECKDVSYHWIPFNNELNKR